MDSLPIEFSARNMERVKRGDEMANATKIVLVDRIEPLIQTIRGQNVILDSDLAGLYGVSTKRLNEQVRRNRERFPDDFMFQLTAEETAASLRSQNATASESEPEMRSQNATASKRNARYRPYAFTEHGTIMVANVLNSPLAVEVGVYVVRAFVKLREFIATHKDLARKVDALERRYDAQFKVVFDAIRKLMAPPRRPAARSASRGRARNNRDGEASLQRPFRKYARFLYFLVILSKNCGGLVYAVAARLFRRSPRCSSRRNLQIWRSCCSCRRGLLRGRKRMPQRPGFSSSE